MHRERSVMLILLVLLLYLSFLVAKPLLNFLLGAFILTFISYPVYRFVRRYLKYHSISAIVVLLLLLLVVLLPSFYFTQSIIGQAFDIAREVESFQFQEINFTELEERWERLTGREVNIRERIESVAATVSTYVAQSALRLLSQLTQLIVGIFVMLFAMYYLYRDGESLLQQISDLLPMQQHYKDRLITASQQVTWALLAGYFLIAIVQGLISTTLYIIFGLPNPLFWGLITIFAGLIPFLSGFVIFIPASIFMLLQGEVVSGLGILIGGLIIVSNIDNVLRPKFVHSRTDIHPVLILVGVIGGIVSFGIIGAFIGPLIFAVLAALLDVYREAEEEREKGDAAADTASESED